MHGIFTWTLYYFKETLKQTLKIKHDPEIIQYPAFLVGFDRKSYLFNILPPFSIAASFYDVDCFFCSIVKTYFKEWILRSVMTIT